MWLQTAFIFLQGAALVGALVVARGGLVAPLVVFGAVILFSRGLGSLFSYLAFEAGASPVMQVLVHYVRIAPNTVLLVYVCTMLARRYRPARNNDLVRVWFGRALYVHGASYLISFAGDLATLAPLLEAKKGLPVVAFLFEAQGYVLGILYGVAAALVFFVTARAGSGPPRLSQRLQNLSWGIAMAGFSGLLLYAAFRQGVRAFYPEGLAETFLGWMSQTEVALFVAYAGGIVAGIFAYYVQSERGRFVERFLGLLELVGDLSEELASSTVARGRVNIPFAAMLQAAGVEFLNLSPGGKRRAANTFRVKILLEEGAGDGKRKHPNTRRRRLQDLAKAYDEELKEPVLAEGLRREVEGEGLPDTLRDLLPGAAGANVGGLEVAERQGVYGAVSLALKVGDAAEGPDPASSPEWEQLVYVAMADAGLLPARRADAVLKGASVSERVLDAYRLALYKLQRYEADGFATRPNDA